MIVHSGCRGQGTCELRTTPTPGSPSSADLSSGGQERPSINVAESDSESRNPCLRVCCICAHDDKLVLPGEGTSGVSKAKLRCTRALGGDNNLTLLFKLVVFKKCVENVFSIYGKVSGESGEGPWVVPGSLLCCPELFISDPQQSKAPTCFQTQHLDSSLVSKGYYSQAPGASHLPSPTAESPSMQYQPRDELWNGFLLHVVIFSDAFRCHDCTTPILVERDTRPLPVSCSGASCVVIPNHWNK